MLYKWMKKIHMWSGLLTFTAFVVWGITGIHAIFLPAPGEWKPPEVSSRQEFELEAPGNLDDKEMDKRIFEAADLKMAGGHYNVHRDENQNLAFDVFTSNGGRNITYFEDKKQVLVEFRDAGLAGFLSSMHTAHTRRGAPDLSARIYGVYNEFATWAFLFMSLSGIYMWVATRPGLPWARIIVGVTTLITAILWWLVR